MEANSCFVKLSMDTDWNVEYIGPDDCGKISLLELIDGIDLNGVGPDISNDREGTSAIFLDTPTFNLNVVAKEECVTPEDAAANMTEFYQWIEQPPELAIQLALKKALKIPTESITAAEEEVIVNGEYLQPPKSADILLDKYFQAFPSSLPAVPQEEQEYSDSGVLTDSPHLVVDLYEEAKKYSPPVFESPPLDMAKPVAEPPRVVVKDKHKLLKSAKAYGVDPAKIKVDEKWVDRKKCGRKTKKVVPADAKTPEYWAKRAKNTEAAKRSRDKRRIKENEFILHTLYLEEKYTALQMKLQEVMKQSAWKKAFCRARG